MEAEDDGIEDDEESASDWSGVAEGSEPLWLSDGAGGLDWSPLVNVTSKKSRSTIDGGLLLSGVLARVKV